jgi:hypothetical protein
VRRKPMGNGKFPPASMTPQEREIWLNSKGGPPDMVLVSKLELGVLGEQLKRALAQERQVQEMFKELSAYEPSKVEPTIQDAVGLAVFDALRYKKAAEIGLGAVVRALSFFVGNPLVVRKDAENALREAEGKINEQFALHRDRRPVLPFFEIVPPPTPPAAPGDAAPKSP